MKKINIAAIDFGNGYFKRTYDGIKVKVDPVVYAKVVSHAFTINQYRNKCMINNEQYLIGQTALESGLPIMTLDSVSEEEKYNHLFYQQLLNYFIILDNGCDVSIDTLVLGVPVHHYAKLHKVLQNKFQSSQSKVNINDTEYTLSIRKVVVFPQPMGTYAMIENASVQNVLVIDIGYGTTDITLMNKGNVASFYGENTGIKHVYLELQQWLLEQFPSLTIDPYTTKDLVTSGTITYLGKQEKLHKDKITAALENQFNILMQSVYRNSDMHKADTIIFTGGASQTFSTQIQALKLKQAVIFKNPQTANVLGFYKLVGAL